VNHLSSRWGALAAAAVAVALAGCGSSSSTSSSTSAASTGSSTKQAAVAKPRPIPAVASPSGALEPKAAGLSKLGPVSRNRAAHLAGLGKVPLTQAIQEVSGDLNHFWSQVFASAKVRWPPMQDVVVDSQPVQTGCSSRPTIAPTDPWFLCDGSQGGTFFWTLPWIQQNIATDQGGVNLAFNMAEMWSFHLQNLFGYTGAMEQGRIPRGAWAEQTMCLTGIYVKALNDRRLFESGDKQTVEAFVRTLSNVNGISAPDVSPGQLQRAFVAGFDSGAPNTCTIHPSK
jgi:predicted metalloprotease